MKKLRLFQILLPVFLLFNCAAQTNFEPLGKGTLNTNFSVGGPIIKAFGTRFPVPYAITGANYGISERINIGGNLHLFSLGYKIAGIDFGAAWFPVLNNKLVPTISLQPRLLVLASTKTDVSDRWRTYPVITNTAAWKVSKNFIYTGYDLTIPFTEPDYDADAAGMIFSPFIGYRWKFGERTQLITEFKWHGANIRSDRLAVEYLSIGGHGAMTTLFTIERGL